MLKGRPYVRRQRLAYRATASIGTSVNASRENIQAHFLQEQENWSKREEYSLGADLEDVEDMRPEQ